MSDVVRCDYCEKDVNLRVNGVRLTRSGQQLDFCDVRCVAYWSGPLAIEEEAHAIKAAELFSKVFVDEAQSVDARRAVGQRGPGKPSATSEALGKEPR
jgi:hypothetical protein